MQTRLGKVPGCKFLFAASRRFLALIASRLDRQFDKKHGTDTGGVIPLKDLAIESGNTEEGIWYEPMSEKLFRQIMDQASINFGKFEFIDFGSGKGRVLLVAAEYGFNKIIGVEFAQELHRIATKNIAIYQRHARQPSNIEAICMDATAYPLPDAPLVIFVYSPFRGKVMKQVLNNITASFAAHPREIILVFYGQNPESIALFKATGFPYRELKLRAD